MAGTKIYFNPGGSGSEVFFGPTEAKIMDFLWLKKNQTVKQIHYCFDESKRPAYTTVMTVMNRLADKNMLHKEKKGRQFLYSPTIDKKKFFSDRLKNINNCLKQFKK